MADFLLKEDGDKLLKEDGDKIVLEDGAGGGGGSVFPAFYYAMQRTK